MKTQFALTGLAATALFLFGCVTTTQTEREFGDSVRAVSTSQIHDLGAAQYPKNEAILGGNADRLSKVVRSHAENVGEAQQVKEAVVVGSPSGN